MWLWKTQTELYGGAPFDDYQCQNSQNDLWGTEAHEHLQVQKDSAVFGLQFVGVCNLLQRKDHDLEYITSKQSHHQRKRRARPYQAAACIQT